MTECNGMTSTPPIPCVTLADYEERYSNRHRIHDAVSYWAGIKPTAQALVSADGSRSITWAEFDRVTDHLAVELRLRGFVKGDYLVTLLAFTIDHVVLEYACFKVGVIVVPLDLRMTASEILRAVGLLHPRGFAALGKVPGIDLTPLWRLLAEKHSEIALRLVFGAADDVAGLVAYPEFVAHAMARPLETENVTDVVSSDDGALVIFTTGSTGSPKPALLSHRNITVQNLCLSAAFFHGDDGIRALVNLPPSHVGGQSEILMTTIFGGGTVVLLEIFDATRTLKAIEGQKVQLLGQIPAMFNLEWLLKDYAKYDLSSVEFAAYGGNAVSRSFVERLATMAPVIGTGLGLTECAGFCSYIDATPEEHESILTGLGHAMPIYPVSIREAMQEDGSAGRELAEGEIGHVCFSGPQTFLGYINDPEATRRAISSDGFLYTGDLGRVDAGGLHLTGRAKWVIKPMGYQVFPGDVEACINALEDKVANSIVVGVPHAVLSEGVVAIVEKRSGAELSVQELDHQARHLASYMRPRHWILLEAGQLPLNRVVKPDHKKAEEMAREAIEKLRAEGGWDNHPRHEALREKN